MRDLIIISTIFAVTAVLFIPVFLSIRSGHRKTLYDDGNIVLRYGRWVPVTMIVLTLLMPTIAAVVGTIDRRDGQIVEVVTVALPILIFLLIVFGPIIWATLRYRIVIEERGLQFRHHFRGRKLLTWEEIEAVRYQRGSNAFTIQCRDGSKLRISMMVMGLDSLLDAFEQNLSLEAIQEAKVGFRRIGREFPPY
jgi:hypothetical protein